MKLYSAQSTVTGYFSVVSKQSWCFSSALREQLTHTPVTQAASGLHWSHYDSFTHVRLTTSKLPGATIRLSITLLIFVTRDRMEDWQTTNKVCVSELKQQVSCTSTGWEQAHALTCSAGVGLRSWFLFSRHSLKAVSSGAGFTLGKAISHLWQTTVCLSTCIAPLEPLYTVIIHWLLADVLLLCNLLKSFYFTPSHILTT